MTIQPESPVGASSATAPVIWKRWQSAFLPNETLSRPMYIAMVVVQAMIAVVVWSMLPSIIPSPLETIHAFIQLVTRDGLLGELWVSLSLNAEAMAISTVISLIISYSAAIPAFRPLAHALSKGRFISLVGIGFVITVFFGGGHILKLIMLVFGMSVFFITSMVDVVEAVPSSDLEYARTLRMTELEVWWEMRVLATADKAFDVLRQNAAMGWLMLTMVEGISRSEGGIGKMLLDQEKHFSLAAIFAIQGTFLVMGILQDMTIRWVKQMAVPHAALTLSGR